MVISTKSQKKITQDRKGTVKTEKARIPKTTSENSWRRPSAPHHHHGMYWWEESEDYRKFPCVQIGKFLEGHAREQSPSAANQWGEEWL